MSNLGVGVWTILGKTVSRIHSFAGWPLLAWTSLALARLLVPSTGPCTTRSSMSVRGRACGYEQLGDGEARQVDFVFPNPSRLPVATTSLNDSASPRASPPRTNLWKNAITNKQSVMSTLTTEDVCALQNLAKSLDGGGIASNRQSVVDVAQQAIFRRRGDGSRPRIRYGRRLGQDLRLQEMLEREAFFLNVLNPRGNTAHSTMVAVASYFTVPRSIFLLFSIGLYGATAYTCASVDSPDDLAHTFCNGGPTGDGGEAKAFTFTDYRSAILNSLATLLFSFYANLAVTEFKQAYFTSQQVKQRVIDLISLAVSEMGDDPRSRADLLDMWRCANLMHTSAYCLSDKRREVYSFDRFLLPTAENFGVYDGEEQLGMFRRAELVGLDKEALVQRKSFVRSDSPWAGQDDSFAGSNHSGAQDKDDEDTEDETVETEHELSVETVEEMELDMLVGDSHGDVRSDAAIVYQTFYVRLHRLIRNAQMDGRTSAAWPVWGTSLINLRSACDELQRRAQYRMPKVYRLSVQFVVLTCLTADTFIMGATIGRVFQEHYDFAVAAAVFATALLLVLLVPSTLLIAACMDMEEPFGNNMMDIPGLSFVRGAAETTLNMVAPHPLCSDAVEAILHFEPNDSLKAKRRGSVIRVQRLAPTAREQTDEQKMTSSLADAENHTA